MASGFVFAFAVLALGSPAASSRVHVPFHALHQRAMNAAAVSGNHSSKLPSFLQKLSDECQCVFQGSCSCEAATEFMNCISNACQSGKCACGGSYHFQQACQNMSDVCPGEGMQCTEEKSTCGAHSVTLPTQAAPLKEALEAVPVKANGPPLATDSANVNVADEYAKATKVSTSQKIVFLVLHVLLMLLCAYIYHRYRHTKFAFPQDVVPSDPSSFMYPLTGCFTDWRMCLMGCCCWQLRWADTIDKNNLGNYWVLVLVFILMSSIIDARVMPFLGLVVVCIMTYFRQQQRIRYGITTVGGCSILEDFLAYWCCLPCAVVQEARCVEAVVEGNVKRPQPPF